MTEEYAELYGYTYDYFDYLYEMTERAAGEIDYLLSLVPTMEEIEQIQQQAERLRGLPANGSHEEALAQLQRNTQKALSSFQAEQPPPVWAPTGMRWTPCCSRWSPYLSRW